MALDNFNPYLFVSAGEQSNKFLTPTYSGGIAQFQAQRAQSLTGLTVRIEGVQEGTGDPSPENIRPISGRTGLAVMVAGKNLFDPNSTEKYWVAVSGSYSEVGSAKSVTLSVASGMTFTMSSSNPRSTTNVMCLAFYDENDNNLSRNIQNNDAYHVTATAPNGSAKLIACCFTYADAGNVQLEIGSTQTAFAPYKASTTYPVTWETEADTVYGGTLDVVSGVLTVDRAIATITRDVYGSNWFSHDASYSTWGFYCNNDTRWRNFIGDIPIGSLISDRFPTVALAYTNDSTCCSLTTQNGVMSYIAFRIPKTAIATPTDSDDLSEKIKNWLDSNPIQICFEIEPQTYQLTPTEVKTLAGYNQIYSDAGPVIDIKF